jgi:hypothetical protein
MRLSGTGEATAKMFVRAVWRDRRLIDVKRSAREIDVPSAADSTLLGRAPKDFPKMTSGLFDRRAPFIR